MVFDFSGSPEEIAETLAVYGSTCTFSGGASFKGVVDEPNSRFRQDSSTEGVNPDEANRTVVLLPGAAFAAGLDAQTFAYLGAKYKVRKMEPVGFQDGVWVTRLICDSTL